MFDVHLKENVVDGASVMVTRDMIKTKFMKRDFVF